MNTRLIDFSAIKFCYTNIKLLIHKSIFGVQKLYVFYRNNLVVRNGRL